MSLQLAEASYVNIRQALEKRGGEQHRGYQTQLYTSRTVCSDSVVGTLEFAVSQRVI